MLLTIVESHSVLQELQVSSAKFPRLWDAWEALKWVLAHSPGGGVMMSAIPPPWYLYRQDSSGVGDPTFVISYSFDAMTVSIHGLSIR
jgi:hypothetical protein